MRDKYSETSLNTNHLMTEFTRFRHNLIPGTALQDTRQSK